MRLRESLRQQAGDGDGGGGGGAQPQWFVERMADLENKLGGAFQRQNQEIQALRQSAAQAAQPQRVAAPAAPTDPTPFRAQIHDRFLNEPERLFAETIAFAEQRADQKIQQTAAQLRQQMEQERVEGRLWDEFYSTNPDCRAFPAEVQAEFARQPAMHSEPFTDWSMRANAARDAVRQRMQWVAEQGKIAAQRQQQDRRAMAGAPGNGFGGPERTLAEQVSTDVERTARAVAERQAMQKRGDAYTKSGDEVARARAAAQRRAAS